MATSFRHGHYVKHVHILESAGRAGRGTPSGTGLQTGFYNKTAFCHVQLNWSYSLHEIFVHQELKALQIIYIVVVFLLVQSKCQPWTASTGSQIHPDRGFFLGLKKLVQLHFGSIA